MHRAAALVVFLSLGAVALAQDPVDTDPDKYRVILENDCVRVLDYRDRPGESTRQHEHPAFVLYALSAFRRSLALPDGRVLAREFAAGEVMWSDAQTHVGTNTGETPTHVLIVELKSGVVACARD